MSAFRIFALLLLSLCCSAQTFTVLHSFKGGPDSGYPFGGAAVDGSGNVYGVTGDTIYEFSVAGQYSVLHTFIYPEGFTPMDTPLLGRDGRIYGTAYQGGLVTGTVWAFAKGGDLGVLHDFSSSQNDGGNPSSRVVQDRAGSLYGTAPFGGDHGHGIVYKVDRSKQETILYSFGAPPDGEQPYGGVFLGKNGSLFGTTQLGGAFGYGTVFRIAANGRETVLHSFNNLDGSDPTGDLTGDAEGNVYGTTDAGGANSSGVIFKVGPGGSFDVLYSFGQFPGDATVPYAGVVRDADGNLYGTTSAGGEVDNGTVYKLNPSTGTLIILHSFSGEPDGGFPNAGVTLDSAGNLYGTTVYGGANNFGMVYKITP